MPDTQSQSIRFLSNDGGAEKDAKLLVNFYSDKDRLKRAFMRLGLFWLLSLASLPIIFAHWVLVPGFFIAGPFAAMMVYRTTQTMDSAKGLCPVCHENIEIKMEPKDTLPKWTYCPHCKSALQISE